MVVRADVWAKGAGRELCRTASLSTLVVEGRPSPLLLLGKWSCGELELMLVIQGIQAIASSTPVVGKRVEPRFRVRNESGILPCAEASDH